MINHGRCTSCWRSAGSSCASGPEAPSTSPALSRGPGSITGWLVDQSVSVTSSSIVTESKAGFACLSHNIPADPLDPDYDAAMKELVDEVVNSDDICCYLTVSGTGAAASQILLVHAIGKYSAGFGALSAFQGTIMAFIGETVGEICPCWYRHQLTQLQTRPRHHRFCSCKCPYQQRPKL
jgi:hypothetical protein